MAKDNNPQLCAAGYNFQEIADFCRCKFTEPLTDEIDRLQTENKRLKEGYAKIADLRVESHDMYHRGLWEEIAEISEQALKGE